MLIEFELTMPDCGSWNGKWSDAKNLHALIRNYKKEDIKKYEIKNKLEKEYYYNWDDGWCACVRVKQIDSKRAKYIREHTKGFHSYDWMIDSILKYNEITTKDIK